MESWTARVQPQTQMRGATAMKTALGAACVEGKALAQQQTPEENVSPRLNALVLGGRSQPQTALLTSGLELLSLAFHPSAWLETRVTALYTEASRLVLWWWS
jgi:hypothetical protein